VAQAGLRRHIVEGRAFMDQLAQRRRFLQRRQILPLQVFDRGNAQAVIIGQAAADFDGHGEIPVQFATLLQKFQGARASPLAR
jgi:hypothetical protein